MKIIRGTKDAREHTVQRQPPGGVNQQRCMKCHGVCTAVPTQDGRVTVSCTVCGANYLRTALDTPRAPKPGPTARPQKAIPKRLHR